MMDLQNFFKVLKKCNSNYTIEKKGELDSNYYNHETCTLNIEYLNCTNLDEHDIYHLNHLRHITGDLILDSEKIEEIAFFNNLTSLRRLVIKDMSKLQSITGFNALEVLNELEIYNNEELESIYGFNCLFIKNKIFKGPIKVINNKRLKNITFLRGILGINSYLYLHHNQITSLDGLEELEFVDASLSLSSNKIVSLKPLINLKRINGMLGIVNNRLTNLNGLESLQTIKTVKWNRSLRSIALYHNKDLNDISAIKNLSEINNDLIIIVDSNQKFLYKPDSDSVFSNGNISVYSKNRETILPKKTVCSPPPNYKNRYFNIRPEFILDSIWKPNMKYMDYTIIRGRNGTGTQLERIDLVRWQDKIYIYHFLKENNIPSMPIIMYSHRQNDDFFDKLEKLYNGGLRSFVVKSAHLANSNGIYRIKDGKFIAKNNTALKDHMFGKAVDFDYLKQEIYKKWAETQQEEDWSSMIVPPGVILEELVEDSQELKFSIVFGEVAGFFIRDKGFPSFDAYGKLLSKQKATLPYWWKEARDLALKVASLVKADHIRIDILYFKSQAIINEITWNGGERKEFTNTVAAMLNKGYAIRTKPTS